MDADEVFRRRVRGMYADPNLTGDLLAVGLFLVDRWASDGPRDVTCAEIASALFPPLAAMRFTGLGLDEDRPVRPDGARVEMALRKDIRRYDPFTQRGDSFVRCGAPMVRRGGSCGGSTSHGGMVTDVATGERSMLGACRRHWAWWDQQVTANRAAVKAAGETAPVPKPFANCGGVLARHLPEVDWPAYWAEIDSRWVPAPERDVPAVVAPTLRLIANAHPERAGLRRRASLKVLPGGKVAQ